MEHLNLSPVISVLGAGLLAVALSRVTRLNVIVWYFIIGALLGDYGFGIVSHNNEIRLLAEVGLAFFLFEVGSHFSLKTLREEWREFLSLGPTYSVIVGGSIALVGITFGIPNLEAFLLGAIFSLSSTAVALKMLEDEGERETPTAQAATAILLFQDILAVILLAIVPALSSGGSVQIGGVIAKVLLLTVAAFVAVVVLGRLILKPFFRWVFSQRVDEVFTASALFAVLLVASAVGPLGLSLPLGAFLAGVALGETNYSYLVRSELLPFRGLLLSLFFLAVGMSLDFYYLLSNIPTLILLTGLLCALKIFSGVIAVKLCQFELSSSLRISGILAQGSEFAFAILAATSLAGMLSQQDTALYAGVIAVSLGLSLPVATLSCRLSGYCARNEVQEESSVVTGTKDVILVQFDEEAWDLASALEAQGIPYRAHDRDWERISAAKSRGFQVYFSNPDRPRTLSRASLGEVSAVVSFVDDEAILFPLIDGLAQVAQDVPLFVVVREPSLMERVIDRGVERVYLQNEFTNKTILKDLLLALGKSSQEALEAGAILEGRISGTPTFSELTASA